MPCQFVVAADVEECNTRLETHPLRFEVEACESVSVELLKSHGQHGFLSAALTAWSKHYPFIIKPDHIWLLLLQAMAAHVTANAEALRDKFVTFQDKLMLLVKRDEFILGDPNNDWPGVITEFDEKILSNIKAEWKDTFQTAFSTTTVTDALAAKVTLMDMCQHYFTYRVLTRCGFPWIRLEGTEADWISIRDKATEMLKLDAFTQNWAQAVLPVLNRFVEAFQGKVDTVFWDSMVKRGRRTGSGGYTFYNGWIHVFIPTLSKQEPNPYCVPYSTDNDYVKFQGREFSANRESGFKFKGCTWHSFPSGLGTAPVQWDYLGTIHEFELVAGFIGAEQGETGAIQARVSWFLKRKGESEKKGSKRERDTDSDEDED
eukprot:c2975_g1_i1.p1 GENE.c2975_g1_i1~~c2975_g1_i1.p1  ORF type:complete len:374 (-),score=80.65 c2975_g1_i1:38-1159(-)